MCFGSGVETYSVGAVHPYGIPINRLSMGRTTMSKVEWDVYLEELKSLWTAERYHLMENNCNNFSDSICLKLLGAGIPSYIIDLPKEFLSTPFGASMRPMIEEMYGRAGHGTGATIQNYGPKHAHTLLSIPTLEEIATAESIVLRSSSDLNIIFDKLKDFVKAHYKEESVNYLESLDTLKGWMQGGGYEDSKILPYEWDLIPAILLLELPVPHLFPLLDILRLLSLNSVIKAVLLENEMFESVVGRILEEKEDKKSRLMLIKWACNLTNRHVVSLGDKRTRDRSVSLMINTILLNDDFYQDFASQLAFNLSWSFTIIKRLYQAHNQEAISELVAALCSALEYQMIEGRHYDEVITIRLVESLGLLLAFGREDELELAKIVGLDDTLAKVKIAIGGAGLKACRSVEELLCLLG